MTTAPTPPPRPWTKKDALRAVELERGGLTQGQIAARLGRSRSSVCQQLRRWRPCRWKQRRLKDHKGELLALYALGLWAAEIGRRLGLRESAVRKQLRGLGLTPHRAPGHAIGRDQGGGRARRDRTLAAGLRAGWPGATRKEADVLTRLYVKGPATKETLAAELGLSPLTVWQRLYFMKRKGLVRHHARLPVPGGTVLWACACEPGKTARPRLDAMREGRHQEDDP